MLSYGKETLDADIPFLLNDRGRFFWKCNRPVVSDKCRFFRWQDGQPPNAAGPSSSASTNNTNVFKGQGQRLSTPSTSSAQPRSSPSTSTQRTTPAPPSSPGKRRRIDDDDDEATHYSEVQVDDDIYSSHPLKQSRPGQSSSSAPMSQPTILSQSQTVEEAMEENWDEDIEDFDDFESGGTGKKPKVGEPSTPSRRFTSFAGPPTSPLSKRTPSTPPKQLAPGLPVTPDTASNNNINRSITPHGISKWQQIRDDPSSPFHARANALLKSETDADISPKSASTASLIARDPSDPSLNSEQRHLEPYETPSKTLLPADNTSPSKSARQASEHVSRFSNMLLNDLETLAKQSESAERQLKAMKQKAMYHEKREKAAQTELAQVKEKLKLLVAENEQLKHMRM